MKNNIYKIATLLLTGVLLTSCLKDDFRGINPDNGTNVIEFGNTTDVTVAGSKYPLYVHSYTISPSATEFKIPISYSGVEAVAPTDITVTVAVAPVSVLTEYNDEQHTTYELYPASNYSIKSSTVVIPKGESKGYLTVLFNTSQMDLTKALALPLKITNVSTGVISGNFGTAIYAVGARNRFDGMYSYSGMTIRNSAAGPDPNLSGSFAKGTPRALETKGPNSVSIVPLWGDGVSGIGGIDGTIATVNPTTNLVTMSSGTNATLKNTAGKPNYYDPATKTFYLAFDWGTGSNTRIVEMVLKYTGPRP